MNWKTVKYNGTQQTGPAKAMAVLMKALKKDGVPFTVEDYPADTAPVDEAPVETEEVEE